MRSAINVAISVDLEMEAVPLCICVEVHEAISIPPAGIQQRRGVGKGEGSPQAAESQQHAAQAAVGIVLQHDSVVPALLSICDSMPLCASPLPLGRLCLERESSDRFPFFSAGAYKGQQSDITQEKLLHILDFCQSNILSVLKPQGKDLWLRCGVEKCKVSKDSSQKLIICSNVIYNPVTSESFPRPYC